MSTLLLVHWDWISSMSTRRTTEHVGKILSSIRQKKSNSLQMTFQEREADMVFSRGKASSPCQRVYDKFPQKGNLYVDSRQNPKTLKYFMQASSNMTGRKNGANIWIKSEQSISRTKPFQNNWNTTLRLNHFLYDPKRMEKGPIKSRSDYHQITPTEQVMFKNKKNDTITSRIWTADMTHSLLGIVLLGQPSLRFEFDTMVSPKISKSACLGKPISFH